MPNHLRDETSPYLLQHVNNPVDWYPWGEEAIELAKKRDKPILLSIGYAACHWCHVMEHESFEDEETAALMNASFVNIKVDREERPDIDSIYMHAVTAMTGRGGWPMTVFLTPDTKPFYAGTYFPKEPRYGMPSFRQILTGVSEAWENDRENVESSAGEVTSQLKGLSSLGLDPSPVEPEIFRGALRALEQSFDAAWGGFGGAPKFPQPMTLEFLLREALREEDSAASNMVETTMKQMARGGIYDQLGGGFSRYSVDARWLVPHFEKMLYDNAQLARLYVHAWQVTGNGFYRRIAEETLDYVLREMRHEDGGFYSSQDADSEGEEGKFYVWSADEIREALGDDAETFMRVYGVSDEGNWEGKNILHLHLEPEGLAAQLGVDPDDLRERLKNAREKLHRIRAERVWPGLDDKVLTAWNGLMLGALADAGAAFGRKDYLDAATANAEFLHGTMRDESGRLFRTWKAGSRAKYNAYLEDYASLADGLLALHQATFDPRWFEWARELADRMIAHFRDRDDGGFYDTSDDHEELLHRPKDLQDNAVPSGNAMAVTVLLQLDLLTGDGRYWRLAEESIAKMVKLMRQYPSAFGQWLVATTLMLSEPVEVALIGNESQLEPLLRVVRRGYRPFQVVAAAPPAETQPIPLLANRPQIDGRGTAYVCRRFVCKAPVTDPEALEAQLEDR